MNEYPSFFQKSSKTSRGQPFRFSTKVITSEELDQKEELIFNNLITRWLAKVLKTLKLLPAKYMFEGSPVGKKTSTRCLKDVLRREARHFAETSCGCPKNVLNANLKDIFVRHLEEIWQDIL